MVAKGGNIYGDADLPCELGSGTEGPNDSNGNVAGGGIIGKLFLSCELRQKWKEKEINR